MSRYSLKQKDFDTVRRMLLVTAQLPEWHTLLSRESSRYWASSFPFAPPAIISSDLRATAFIEIAINAEMADKSAYRLGCLLGIIPKRMA